MQITDTTTYHMVTKLSEYKLCHGVIKQAKITERKLEFPTVYAKRDGKVIGVAGNGGDPERITLATFCCIVDPPWIVLIRLVEAFEEVLRASKVVTEYIVAVDIKNPRLNEYVTRILGYPPYAQTEHNFWYRRVLDGRS